MTLSFPNTARSYDEAAKRVRFLGYDGVFEIRFFVNADVLSTASANGNQTEREYLDEFDSMRVRILEVAKKAYSSARASTIILSRKNF